MPQPLIVAFLFVLACNRSSEDTTETDTSVEDSDSDQGPYPCSDMEATPGGAEACETYVTFLCRWNQCANPEMDLEQCIEDGRPSCADSDEGTWCALEECVASVPDDTVCPEDAAADPYWYLDDPSCAYLINPD